MRIKRNPDQRLRRSEHHIRDPQLPARLQHIVRAHSIGAELATAVCLARGRDRSEMDDGVDGVVCHVNCHEGFHDRTHVLKIDFDEAVGASEPGLAILAGCGRAPGVYGDDLPAFVGKVFDCGPAKLAASSGDDDALLIRSCNDC